MNELSGFELYDCVMAGAQKIIDSEEQLNAINVFPVADGDTGSNLAYTMKCILAGAIRTRDVDEAIASISSVALEDAYGNSGTIFASYLYGLSKAYKGKKNLTLEEFSEGAYVAVDYAYDALAMPLEGTILTVMKSWGMYLKDHGKQYRNFTSLLSDSIVQVRLVLESTQYQLKVLKDSGVVDAGARGFVYFLEGILEHVRDGVLSRISDAVPQTPIVHDHGSRRRYCTEMIIEPNELFDKKGLIKTLSNTDESVIVQKIGDYYKVHTHTDHPSLVAEEAILQGKIIKSKVDDMNRQVQFVKQGRKPIGILTDSIACISEKAMDSGLVHVVPLQLIFNGNTYVDGLTINNETLFRLMDSIKQSPTSSQASETELLKTLNMMLAHFDEVICIFVSSQMSGMYQKIQGVSQKTDYSRVRLLDSLTNTAAEGLMIDYALACINRNYSAAEVVDILMDQRDKFQIYVEIPDLEFATRSGRVPKFFGMIAGTLKLKAIISVDSSGKGIVTKESSLFKLAQKTKDQKKCVSLGIVYTGDIQDHLKKISDIEAIFQMKANFVSEASTVISGFMGKGAFGFAITEVSV